MAEATATDIVTVVTILKNVLVNGIQADRGVRSKIAGMTDEEVIAYAREIIADTDRRAGEFLDRLDGEQPE